VVSRNAVGNWLVVSEIDEKSWVEVASVMRQAGQVAFGLAGEATASEYTAVERLLLQAVISRHTPMIKPKPAFGARIRHVLDIRNVIDR